ncbi:MAG TPA: GNAT family N-acetyltransferase [Mycobacteriales bacterium]|nr:GNAT family N-acetyltransferase [Mycobacteriales bacterium]
MSGDQQSAGYPEHWEADVLLSDGGTAHVRPILPGDAGALRRLFGRLTPRTLYLRFHGPHPRLSSDEVRHFTEVDHVGRISLVAIVGSELVGVSNAERYADSDRAEIAFLIRDDQQGRGVGSLLLEHLAAAARERGIRTFEAWVLADNRRMLNVFADAGYLVRSTIESGEALLNFEVSETLTSVEVGRSREHAAETRSIRRLLQPDRVALVLDGSPRGDEQGSRIIRGAPPGRGPRLLAVHPRRRELAGLPAVPRLRQLTDIDLVVACGAGAGFLPTLIQDAAALSAHALLIAADAGLGPHLGLRDLARAQGLRVVGPASAGVLNLAADLVLWNGPVIPEPGPVGVFCQSAPTARAVLSHARRRGVGVSSVIDAGDRADLSGNDLLQFWRDDPATQAVLMVLETFGNPRKFLRLVAAIGALKPVVVVRPTGDDLVDELLRRAGVIRVAGLVQGLDVIRVLTRTGAPHGIDVQVIAGSSAAERLGRQALIANGLTVSGGARPDARLVVSEPDEPQLPVPDDAVPTVTLRLGADLPAAAPETAFRWPESAAAALSAAAAWQRWRGGRQPVSAPGSDPARAAAARRWLGRQGAREPAREQVAALLADYQIPVLASLEAGDEQAAVRCAERLGWPVVVKTLARAARHRPELGAVTLNLHDPHALAAAFRATREAFGPAPVLVQHQAAAGVPVLLRSREDARVGPVVSCIVGSLNAALGLDETHRSAPLGLAEARELVTAGRSAALLQGWKGAPASDIDALAELAAALSTLADDLPALRRLELGPILVHPVGVSVLGAEALLGAGPDRRADTGPRRMF